MCTLPVLNVPVRYSGPLVSSMMAMGRSSSSRTFWIMRILASCSSCVPWEKLRRATFTPALHMAENTPGSLLAGPMVAMIFVFLMVLFPSNQVQMKRPVRLSLSIRENASIKKKITGMLFASFSDKRKMRPVKRGVCLKKGTEPSWLCPGCARTGRNAPASKRIGRAAPYDRLHHSLGRPYFSTK